MGRVVDRVHPVFRIGAVLLLAASLLLVVENAAILGSTASFATGGGLNLGAPTDTSSASNTSAGIFDSAGGFLGSLSFATTMDMIGFSLLAAAMVAMAIGSRWIDIRMRFDGSPVRKSRLIPAGALTAAAGFGAWVALTASWRSALTGSPTGDWSGMRELFDPSGVVSGSGPSGSIIPAAVQHMIDAFPTVTGLWMLATIMLIVAAIGILIAGAGFRRATGLRAGGVGFLVFSVVAFIGLIVFIGSVSALFAAVEEAFATGGQGIETVFASLAIAMGVKLAVVPFWAIIGFSLLAVVGLRFSLLRAGSVLLTPEDVKAIKAAGGGAAAPSPGGAPATVGGAPAEPPSGSFQTEEPMPSALGAAAAGGDVVVELPPKPPEPPAP